MSGETRNSEPPSRGLVVGYGVTGRAVAAALRRRGGSVLVVDDNPTAVEAQARADGLVVHPGDVDTLRELLGSVDMVLPSPGVAQHHPSYRLADEMGIAVVSEFDLAARWDDRPIAAITGTNGKTTVTTLVTTMLRRSGIAAVAAGNTDTPLVNAIDADPPAEMFVVEASSFRLERVELFAPRVAAWLNLAPDHLDWHEDLAGYAAAKARIWARQGSDDVAVVPVDEPIVLEHARGVRGRVVTFGNSDRADVGVIDGWIVSRGEPLVEIAKMRRNRYHDLKNATAAAAVALSMGASRESIAAELVEFAGLPHRLQNAGTVDGVCFYNDSKATAPHATLAALKGFERAVLIAGGRNKDLDLSGLGELSDQLVAVVAIGEASEEIAAVFEGRVPVEHAASMGAAVDRAWRLGLEGRCDVVLSPACASFDWYRSYEDRGDDFLSLVDRLADKEDR